MDLHDQVVIVRGEQELHDRTAHLFAGATSEIACAANTLYTWVATNRGVKPKVKRVRKMFRLSAMLDPSWSQHAHVMADHGADVRVSADELNETILIDRRIAILAGDAAHGLRSFSVITRPEVVHGITSLFDAAWRAAKDLRVHDAEMTELRTLAPQILDALHAGWKDETAARALGLSLRTYRRRVAELMAALGATSRFQAGALANELGLI
ncbi:MAG TPA: DNA-binding response regulator [Pseudonocardiaceae bacterium]|jgi:DNA-binding NarL/FixJ family response regulator|nr:DNA-binding response regulator [Pseudonocardiaceae bacterium]